MKKTLASILNPQYSTYWTIGEYAAVLNYLMRQKAKEYRDQGHWGSSGPWETLVNHNGCVNSLNETWHSSRITSGQPRSTTTWEENIAALHTCIMGALCSDSPAFCQWRKELDIHLQTVVKVPMGHQFYHEEKKAWEQIERLHKHTLKVPTLNSAHRGVNVLAEPQLIISESGVFIECSVTDKQELQSSPLCYSRWQVAFLCREHPPWDRLPRWIPQRETFAEFCERAAHHYRGITASIEYKEF